MLALQVGSEGLGVGAEVPIGMSAAILIGGRNDMTIAQEMGARWEVTDPDGQVVDSYFDWALFSTPPGQEHGFVGNQFVLEKLGAYTVRADLLMNPGDPVVVDTYGPGLLCVVTEGVPPEYGLIQHTVYPFAYIYNGEQEFTVATFRTDPFVPSAWLAERFASKLEDEVRSKGGRPLEVKVYVDTTPLLWTGFRIEISSTPIGGVTEGIGVGIALWLAILIVCLAITAVIIVATWAFKTILAAFKTKPGLDDVKPAWGKETLILTIQDAEEHWERTPTPVETLAGMSEENLRHLLNQIAEEEVPSGIEWAAVAVAGVLAAGVVVAGLVFARPARG